MKTWDEIKKARLAPEQISQAEEWARQESLKMTLAKMRKELGLTQKVVAARLGNTQSEVSKFEHRGSHLVSVLRKYIQALGGELEIYAVFPDKKIKLKIG